jgi:hypothetical protein
MVANMARRGWRPDGQIERGTITDRSPASFTRGSPEVAKDGGRAIRKRSIDGGLIVHHDDPPTVDGTILFIVVLILLLGGEAATML